MKKLMLFAMLVGCAVQAEETEKPPVIVTEKPTVETYVVDGDAVSVTANAYGEAKAYCKPGDTVIGGGCAVGVGGEVRYAIPMRTDGEPQFFLCFVLAGEKEVTVDPRATCAKGVVEVK